MTGRQADKLALGVAGLLALAGCATTTVTCTSLERGDCTVSSSRMLTDSAVVLTTPDGVALNFSSKPNEAGTAAAFKVLSDTIGVLSKMAAAPVVPPKPATIVANPFVAPDPDAALQQRIRDAGSPR